MAKKKKVSVKKLVEENQELKRAVERLADKLNKERNQSLFLKLEDERSKFEYLNLLKDFHTLTMKFLKASSRAVRTLSPDYKQTRAMVEVNHEHQEKES